MSVDRTAPLGSGFVAPELGRRDVLGCSERVSLLDGLGVSKTFGLGVGAASESDRPDLLVCDGLGLFNRSAARAPAIRISSSVGSADVDFLPRDLGFARSSSVGVAVSEGACSAGGVVCLGASGFVSRATITSCAGVRSTSMKPQSNTMKNPSGINRRDRQLQPVRKPPFTRLRLSRCPCDLDYRQRKTHPQFVLQINFHVMQPILLKLYSAKIMNICCVAFHLLQYKFHFRLSDDLLFIDTDDA